jgi:hypothetical protein
VVVVEFKLIKKNGHVAHTDTMEEKYLKTFLRGTGQFKIVYIKDGVEYTIENQNAEV